MSMWTWTLENYQRVQRFFPQGSRRLAMLKAACSMLSVPVWFAYPALLAVLWQAKDARLLRVLLVPAAAFLACTLLRRWWNLPRPYDQPGFTPLVPKEPRRVLGQAVESVGSSPDGLSCPSRHATSAAVIALAAWYINPGLGGVLAVLAVLISLVRVLAGIHHLRDVVLGMLLSGLIGAVGFWLV